MRFSDDFSVVFHNLGQTITAETDWFEVDGAGNHVTLGPLAVDQDPGTKWLILTKDFNLYVRNSAGKAVLEKRRRVAFATTDGNVVMVNWTSPYSVTFQGRTLYDTYCGNGDDAAIVSYYRCAKPLSSSSSSP